jgi:hypothetical protein
MRNPSGGMGTTGGMAASAGSSTGLPYKKVYY